MVRVLFSVLLCVVELALLLQYLSHIFDRKHTQLPMIFGAAALYVVPSFVFIRFSLPQVNAVLFTLTDILIVFLFFRASFLKNCIACLLFEVLINLTEFLTMAVISLFSNRDISAVLQNNATFMLLGILSKTMLLLLAVPLARIVFPHGGKAAGRTPLSLFLLPLSAVCIDFALFFVSVQVENRMPKLLVSAGAFVLLVAVMLTYIFYGKAMERRNALLQLQAETEKQQTDRQYYTAIEHRNREMQRFLCEENEHLTALRAKTQDKAVEAYIDDLLAELRDSGKEEA